MRSRVVTGLVLVTMILAASSLHAQQTTESELRAERIARFLEHLGKLRAGEPSAEALLLEVANQLCEEHERCDTLGVARYYAALSRAELERGVGYEGRYRALYGEVRAARNLEGEAWLSLRARVLADLIQLAATSAADADFAPAGRALSLAALLRAESLERRADRDAPSWSQELRSGLLEAERSLTLLHNARQESPQLEATWAQGRLLRLSGRREQARTSFEACLSGADRLGYATWGERALIELLQLAREVGDTQAQERLLERLSNWTHPEESWPLVMAYADWVLNLDQPQLATEILAQYRPTPEPLEWHVLSGSAALRAGDLEVAARHFDWLNIHEDGPTRSARAGQPQPRARRAPRGLSRIGGWRVGPRLSGARRGAGTLTARRGAPRAGRTARGSARIGLCARLG